MVLYYTSSNTLFSNVKVVKMLQELSNEFSAGLQNSSLYDSNIQFDYSFFRYILHMYLYSSICLSLFPPT